MEQNEGIGNKQPIEYIDQGGLSNENSDVPTKAEIPESMRVYCRKNLFPECWKQPNGHLLSQKYEKEHFKLIWYTADIHASQDFEINYHKPILQLVLIQQGEMAWYFDDTSLYHGNPGEFTLQFSPTGDFTLCCRKGAGVYKVFVLQFDPLFLKKLHVNSPATDLLYRNMARKTKYTIAPFKHFFRATDDMLTITDRLFENDLPFKFRSHHFSLSAADLLVLSLSHLDNYTPVSAEDVEVLEKIERTLVEDKNNITNEEDLSLKLGISRNRLRTTYRQYYGETLDKAIKSHRNIDNNHLFLPGLITMPTTRYTEEQQIQAVTNLKNGGRPKDICRELGISQTTLSIWYEKYKDAALLAKQVPSHTDISVTPTTIKENERLTKICMDLRQENTALRELLKKMSSPSNPL